MVADKNETPESPKPSDAHTFSIAGLGVSAGGLEAFETFFRHMSPVSGIAFVLISHLDPSHASILTEILQRSTSMPVVEVQDQMKVEPDHVYVIPPNRDMAIFHGVLQFSVPEQPRGQRLPIDAFLRSLAEDQGENAIGIILSGIGTDGTLGLRAILGAGGVSLVQEPANAKYDGMPESAIQAGYATRVLTVEKMPEVLLTGLRAQNNLPIAPAAQTSGLNRILMQLRSVTGHDVSQYKKSTIGRRIERRMAMHTIGNLQIYQLGNNQWGIPELRDLLENILPKNQVMEGFRMEHDFPVIGHRKLLLNARRISDGKQERELILLVMEDV